MDENLNQTIKAELTRISGDVGKFISAQKERHGALDSKTLELQARLLDVEQRLARRGAGDPGASFGGGGEGAGSAVIKAQGLDQLRSGELKTLRIPIGSFPKAALTTQNYPGLPDRDSEIYGPLPRRLYVEDLIPTRPTSLSAIDFVQATRTGAAAVQLSMDSPGVTDGAVKAEINFTAELKQAKVVTVAAFTSCARQVLDDDTGLQDFVDSSLRDAVNEATEAQILAGSGLPGNLNGLLTLATNYNRHVSGDNAADSLRRACTQVQLARGVATGIVINPATAEGLELLKDSQKRYLLVIELTDDNGRTIIWRVPTVITDAIAGDTFLVGDFSRATRLWDRQQYIVSISLEHSDYFTRNLAAILGERRLALTVPRPTLLIKGQLGVS